MKVEIEFEKDFASDKLLFKSLGRLMIGDSTGRLFLGTDGKVHLYIKKDPCLHIMKGFDCAHGFGLSKPTYESNNS